MNLHREWLVGWAVAFAVLALSVCSSLGGQSAIASLRLDEKTIPLKPSVTFVKASFLTGELRDLRVVERFDHGTGKMVGGPVLRATLTVTNDSEDEAARLFGGKIEYIDSEGRQIRISHTAFPFIGIESERLDPGMHVSQAIEVAFPPSALKPHDIKEVSLELICVPIHSQEGTLNMPAHFGG